MTQKIDPVKLKAAAEHFEWVLNQYPNEPVVQDMLDGLSRLIEDAKNGRVKVPVGRIPFGYQFSDYVYWEFKEPNVECAYVRFCVEMEGGHTEQGQKAIEYIASYQESKREEGGSE